MGLQILTLILSGPGAVIIVSIVACVLALLFHKQIGGFLDRLIEIRAARTKEGVALAVRGAEQALAERVLEKEEKTREETREVVKERQAGEAFEPHIQAFNALLEKDFEAYEQIYGKMISGASSDKEKAQLHSLKLSDYWLWHKRDVKADLSKLAERYPNSHHPLEGLALIYEDLEKYEKAERLYRQAIEVCDDPKERFSLELRLCRAMRLHNRFEAAEKTLTEMLTRYKSDKQVSDIYQEWGELLLAQDNMYGAQDHFEEALDYEPNKNYLRFQTAYRYSEMGKEENALYHCKMLRRLDPDSAGAWNNLGVAYGTLDMPIKAVECYKRAAELNNSLAMANMAQTLIGDGFIEEAREWIHKGLECKEVHGNVGRALSYIEEKVKQEAEKEKGILQSLRKKVWSEEEILEEQIPF